MLAQESLANTHDILDGVVMHLPMTPGEARSAFWDINNNELVRQTLGVGSCLLTQEVSEAVPERCIYGDIIDGDRSVGRFLVCDTPPRKTAQFLGKVLGYEPAHVFSVVAGLNEKRPQQDGLFRDWGFRLRPLVPGFLKSKFTKLRERALRPAAEISLTQAVQ